MKRIPYGNRLLLVLALMSISPLVQAQWLGADYAAHGAQYSSFVASSYINQSIINRGVVESIKQTKGGSSTEPSGSVTKVSSGGEGVSTANELGSRFPSAQRAQVTKAFVQSLTAWGQLAKKLGVDGNDLGSAAAAFIAGNWMVATGQELPDAQFKTLAMQMQQVLSTHEPLKSVSTKDKRKMFEQLAMVGTFMALAQASLHQHADANAEANLKQSARENLMQLLNVSVGSIQIGEDGLRLK